MAETTKIVRKKCGQIFILANDIFSLICEFCGDDLQSSLEDFRAHLTEHFPEKPTIIKNEDSNSRGRYVEFIPDEIQDDVKYNLTDDLQGYGSSRSSLSIGKEIIQGELKLNVVTRNIEDIAEGGELFDENGMQTEMSTSRKYPSEAKSLAAADMSHPFQCEICQWSTTRKNDIRQHMRNIHTREWPFEVCSKSSSLKSVLNQHLRAHTGEKPHKCNVCSKRFVRTCDLTRHMKTHTAEKPHKCNVCSKRFSMKFPLSIHMRTHTGEKPYKCNVCSKRFSQTSILNRHMRTHTGEKPYKCNVCSKRFLFNKCFSHKIDLTKHMKTRHTGENSPTNANCAARDSHVSTV